MSKADAEGGAYARAGVDITAGNALIPVIAPLAAATARPGAMPILGGFGGIFDLARAGFRDPVLVAAADGVGSKIMLAAEAGRLDIAGYDLVAMCVNDLISQGAEPLFFLDYMASERLDPVRAREIVEGICRACKESGAALIGGETAAMPGLYAEGAYDLAGFAVGAAERGALLPGALAAPGDLVLGLASDGVHSNGFALVRKIMDEAGLTLASPFPPDASRTLAEILLAPTRIYVRPVLALLRALPGRIKGVAHITGGGLTDNIPRAIGAQGLAAHIDAARIAMPGIFGWLAQAGSVSREEMFRVFNCGIGLAVICAPEDGAGVAQILEKAGERVARIGVLREREPEMPAIHIEGFPQIAA